MRQFFILTALCAFGISFSALHPDHAEAVSGFVKGTDAAGHLAPFQHSAYYRLMHATRLSDQGQVAQALPDFERAVEANPTSVLCQYNLGFALMSLAMDTTDPEQKERLLARAEWAFMRSRDLNPDLSLTYFKLGKVALMREDYAQARDHYQSAVEMLPDNAALWFNLASTYEKLNAPDKAERAYLKVIALNPRFVFALNNLALLYEQRQRYQEAETLYRDALVQIPEYNYARLNLGSLLQSQGRYNESKALYEEALVVEPENPWAHLYLGNIYYKQGDYQKALEAYNQAISLNPDYPTAYYLASLTLQKLNRNEEAVAKGLQYINLAPNGAFSQEAKDMVMTLDMALKKPDLHK